MEVVHEGEIGRCRCPELCALGCGYSTKAGTDYDKAVNFTNYSTFFMVKGNSSGNPLLDQRASADVQNALVNRGWASAAAR
jgi:hypothetical protein